MWSLCKMCANNKHQAVVDRIELQEFCWENIRLWASLAETPKGTDNSAPWLPSVFYWISNYGFN